jgi:quercetin dioxygenase-like cupin family protein
MRAVLSIVAVLGLSAGVVAQDANVQVRDELTILQRQDIVAKGYQAVTAVDVLAPGARVRWHTHPGEMIAFVTEGRVTIEQGVAGQGGNGTATFGAGESFIIPAGVAHSSFNTGSATARMFVTFLVDKHKATTSPVAAPGR